MTRTYRLFFAGVLATTLLAYSMPVAWAQSDQHGFDQTGFCISGRIRNFW